MEDLLVMLADLRQELIESLDTLSGRLRRQLAKLEEIAMTKNEALDAVLKAVEEFRDYAKAKYWEEQSHGSESDRQLAIGYRMGAQHAFRRVSQLVARLKDVEL